MKPKLCEILGVEVDEEFVYEHKFYRVSKGGEAYKYVFDPYERWVEIYIPAEWINGRCEIRRFK